MSSHLKAELAATCSTLGRLHKGEYLIEPDCVESVKDLIRYLKRDDESHEIRSYLGESKVLQNDLVHIIKSCPEENSELFDVTLRLLINLTTPPLIFYRDEIPPEKIGRNIYLNLIGYTQCYKIAFCDVEFWSKICGKLTNLFETDWSERSADDGIQIERILLLLRNVLQIPADEENEKRPENDITVHDKVLWALRQSQFLELLLFLSSNRNEEQYFLNLLEIFSLVLREQSAKVLAQCDLQRSGIEKEKDADDLVKAREFEKHNRNKYRNVRKFSATFVLKGVKSLSDNDVVCHNVPDKVDILKPIGLNKKQVRSRKNRIPIESERVERRSTFSIRLFLKEFCVEFLSSAFSGLMDIVKNKVNSGKSLANDQSYYFWALKFFLEFATSLNSDMTLIQDVISVETFHFVQMSIDDAFEHLLADKKKTTDWVKRIHLLLKAYHSLLQTLFWMDCSKNALARSVSREIKSQIFSVAEYREMTLHIFLRYDPTKFSISYLRDIIETAHLFIKLLEEHSRQTKLVIQKLVKKKSKTPKGKKVPVKENREEKWEKIKDDVCDILCSKNKFPEIPPFDAALEIPIDDQKNRAMKKIQRLLHCGKIGDGIGLLRSARQVWPENEFFGSQDVSIEEEILALKEIFIADLCVSDCDSPLKENEGKWEENGEEKESEDDSKNQVHVVEKEFDILEYKKRLVNRKIIQGCGILLKNYKKNSDHTNHCIIKLLYRVGWECCMPAMLYQASLFWTLLKILQDKNQEYSEINTFTMNLLRKFRKHASEHPVVFLDLLFWKDYKAALEIQHRYESYSDEKKTSKSKKNSGEIEERKKGRATKQKRESRGENNEKLSRNAGEKKTGKQIICENLSSSGEFHDMDISNDGNKSSVHHKNRTSRILFKDNFNSVDEQMYEKPRYSGFDGNTHEEIRSKVCETPNKNFKRRKYGDNKFKVFNDDGRTDTQNLKRQIGRESKKLKNDLIEVSPGRETGRRFGEENGGTDSFSWEQTNFAYTENSSGHTTHPVDQQENKKESKSQNENSSIKNDSAHNFNDETSNATPKKLLSKANNKKNSKYFGENFMERNYSKLKRVRYISSDSDNYQSEDEKLTPVRTKRWRMSVIIDSDSD